MTERAEVALIRRLIVRHNGCLSKMATDYGRKRRRRITRAGFTKRMRNLSATVKVEDQSLSLEEEAAAARALAGVTGGRSALPEGTVDAISERAAMLDALATSPNNVVAARLLGLDYRQLYRRKGKLGITAAEIVSHRKKLQSAGDSGLRTS